jgi:hypothetical protein
MSKAISYYDWKSSFDRKSIPKEEEKQNYNEAFNNLGIEEDNFKEFLSKWKERNLD